MTRSQTNKLNKLEYTLKIASSKLEELEHLDDKIQSNLTSLFKQHFQELTPHPKTVENIELDHTKFNSETYKNLISVGCVTASEEKDTTQMKNTIGNKLSVDNDNSKREKTKDSHNNNPSKQQNVNKKKDVKRVMAVKTAAIKIS